MVWGGYDLIILEDAESDEGNFSRDLNPNPGSRLMTRKASRNFTKNFRVINSPTPARIITVPERCN